MPSRAPRVAGRGTGCRHGETCRRWRRASSAARGAPLECPPSCSGRPPAERGCCPAGRSRPPGGQREGAALAEVRGEGSVGGRDPCLCSPTWSATSGLSSRDNSEIVLRPGTRRSLCTPGVVAVFLVLKFVITAGDSCDKFTCSILEKRFAVCSTLSLQGWKQEVGKVVLCELWARQRKEGKPAPGLQQRL